MNNVPLKEFFLSLMDGIKTSTKIAYDSMEKRLEGMNEFRDTLKDQAGRFITRDELNLVISRLEGDIKNLQIAKAILEGKASQSSVNISLIISIIGILIAIVGIVLKFF